MNAAVALSMLGAASLANLPTRPPHTPRPPKYPGQSWGYLKGVWLGDGAPAVTSQRQIRRHKERTR